MQLRKELTYNNWQKCYEWIARNTNPKVAYWSWNVNESGKKSDISSNPGNFLASAITLRKLPTFSGKHQQSPTFSLTTPAKNILRQMQSSAICRNFCDPCSFQRLLTSVGDYQYLPETASTYPTLPTFAGDSRYLSNHICQYLPEDGCICQKLPTLIGDC